MTRTAIVADAVGFFAALAIILSALFIPTEAYPTDDHGMKEVEAYAGAPSTFRHDMCGGGIDQYGEKIAKWACTVWFTRPDKDGDRIAIFFDRKTGSLIGIGWIYASGATSGPAEKARMLDRLHEKLHEARPGAKKSSAPGQDT